MGLRDPYLTLAYLSILDMLRVFLGSGLDDSTVPSPRTTRTIFPPSSSSILLARDDTRSEEYTLPGILRGQSVHPCGSGLLPRSDGSHLGSTFPRGVSDVQTGPTCVRPYKRRTFVGGSSVVGRDFETETDPWYGRERCRRGLEGKRGPEGSFGKRRKLSGTCLRGRETVQAGGDGCERSPDGSCRGFSRADGGGRPKEDPRAGGRGPRRDKGPTGPRLGRVSTPLFFWSVAGRLPDALLRAAGLRGVGRLGCRDRGPTIQETQSSTRPLKRRKMGTRTTKILEENLYLFRLLSKSGFTGQRSESDR